MAKAWVLASSGPIVEFHQTVLRFTAALYSAFFDRANGDGDPTKSYEFQSSKFAKLRMNDVAAKILKFQRKVCLVSACNANGTTKETIMSLAIALLTGKIDKMLYEFTSPSYDVWTLQLMYEVLRSYPKLMFQMTTSPCGLNVATNRER